MLKVVQTKWAICSFSCECNSTFRHYVVILSHRFKDDRKRQQIAVLTVVNGRWAKTATVVCRSGPRKGEDMTNFITFTQVRRRGITDMNTWIDLSYGPRWDA